MKNNNRVTPVGLKGNEINERMKQLMGIQPINENKSTSVVELTKRGPDGNAYAIVRENHEYYIKYTSKQGQLVAEDFKYIGGLQNKKLEAYPSYARAIKRLDFKLKSLNEAFGGTEAVNTFEDDNLMSEAFGAGFSEFKGNGFTGEGNLEGNQPLPIGDIALSETEQAVEDMVKEDEKTKNNPWAICTASTGREDKAKYERCVKDVKKEKGVDENLTEEEYMADETEVVNENKKLSILRAIEQMDSIIDTLSEGKVKKKVYTIK